MNVFFSDLDNTLIYSHRKQIQGEKVLVERLDGKEQSFMTDYAFSFLRVANWFFLVPVTTRTELQYRRLLLQESLHIKYALICNGGKLLVDGAEDLAWTEKTMELVHEDLLSLEKLGKQLEDLSGKDVRTPESYYYYVKTDEPERICYTLRRKNQNCGIQIEHDHRKVYLFPSNVNKGMAVRRFMEKYKIKTSIGAGDSIIDVSMLNEVNYPMSSEPVCGLINNPNIKQLTGELISDQICDELKDLHRKGIM